jgi:4-aminobutyrate aminotransferase-like enzyme
MPRPRSYIILASCCAIRITPPLTISEEEIKGCAIIIEVMNEVPMTIKKNKYPAR